MARLLFILIVVVLLAVLLGRFGIKQRPGAAGTGTATFPYRRRKALFSAAERSFLGVLDREVEGRYRVFGKVALKDVLEVVGAVSRAERGAAYNRVSQKHLDFVLCRPGDLSVVAGIELDDSSHDRADRKERDLFVEAACRAAGLPLLRFPAKATYTAAEIRAALAVLEEPIEVIAPEHS
ncbi:MAG: DUF2726 domain-containing protein [Trueperaceae bacterium]|nr:DUF2726 domain-containing protein [Trueperaceae bacterium]